MSGTAVTTGTDDDWRAAVDLERLARWMDTQGLEQGEIFEARALTGGTQNILVRFRRGAREFVLRRPPVRPRPEGNKTLLREARVLAAVAATDVPHARLIAACADADVLGAPFYLMAPVEGFNASASTLPALHASDPALRRRMGFSMVDALLSLGTVDADAVGLADFGRIDGFLERQVSRWRTQLDAYASYAGWPGASALPGVTEVGRWLELHRPQRFLPGVLHGDFHLANVMFRHDGPEVAAVIDWELATLGDPLLDLGWLVATWPDASGQGAGTIHVSPWNGFASAADLVAYYGARSPRDLGAIDWYVVLASYKLGILLEGSHARSCAGQLARVTGERHHVSAVRLLESAQARLSGTPA
jgi:aminoglycoside phosphotransferase (APT) family kinase protein